MRLIAIVMAWITSVLTLLLIAGHGPWAGRALITLDSVHGLNTGDIPVLFLWAASMYCCWDLWGRGDPH